ncbi:hypothetical protein H0H93_007085 [Arthromyces matolae]|nr:hypothetical protein H0H93_007085 [Arthromyces matolae]
MQSVTEDLNFRADCLLRSGLLRPNASADTSNNNLHSLTMVRTSSEGYTDVLIVGAAAYLLITGPAGLMTAMSLARMGIRPIIIDGAGYDAHEYGRADALQPRSMEVLQSFGIPLDQLESAGKKIFGRAFWEISEETTRRTALARFFPPFLDFEKDYALAVRQGLIEQVMIYDIERHIEGFEVRWNCEFLDMELGGAGPNSVLVRDTLTGKTQTLLAKYVVAADGGRSSVRRWASSYGVKLEGESHPVTWCVLDAVNLRSNHPDLERLTKRLAVKIGKPDVIPGSRIRPACVTRLSDMVPVPIAPTFDGRFMLYFLVGDLSQNGSLERLVKLDAFLRRPRSIFSRFGSNLSLKPSERRLSPSPMVPMKSTSDLNLPKGRALYTYVYDDIPQPTEQYHGSSHSIFNTSIISTIPSTSPFIDEHITRLIYPTTQLCIGQTPSPIFRPHRFYSDDIPIVSPYRQSAPEAGAIFEYPLHQKWGVDVDCGSIVVVRPDGHVALKTDGFGIEVWQEVESYFEGFLIPQKAERTSLKRKGAAMLTNVDVSISDL